MDVDETTTVDNTDPILAELNSEDDQPSVNEPEEVETESAEQSDTEETTEQEVDTEAEAPVEGEQSEEDSEAEEEELQTTDPVEEDPKELARRHYEERQIQRAERRAAIEAQARQQAEEHVKQSEDEYDQRLRNQEARDMEREAERYVEKIENNENQLVTEFERVKANPDLQIFNPDNKELFNEKAYDKALRDYNAGYIQYDPSGNMVGIKGSLFEHLTETADLLKSAVQTGAVQQVRASKQMKASADTKPAATPKQTSVDPILEILKSDD